MNNLDKIKIKKILLIYIFTSLLTINSYEAKNKNNYNYEILIDQEAFASYSKGLIYIGDKEYLENIENINEYDILVEDCRDSETNPEMKVHSSYKILDKKTREEILEVLCIYEEYYPSNWDRTIDSMKLEWTIHNWCYIFNFKRDHTTDVDLDNKDEKKYDIKILSKLLGL